MRVEQIEKEIQKLRDRRRGALPPSIEHQVRALDEHTLALLEVALQVGKKSHQDSIREAEGKEGVLTLIRELNIGLSAIVAELGALRKTVDQFGPRVVSRPSSGGPAPADF